MQNKSKVIEVSFKSKVIEVSLFKCPKCGTIYNNKKDAEGCLVSHAKPSKVTGMNYKPYTFDNFHGYNYPSWVEVTFENGMKVRYDRGKILTK